MAEINIKGLDKARILAALFNHAKQTGDDYTYTAQPMSVDEARERLRSRQRFNHLEGRSLHIDLSGDVLDTLKYDRVNGAGTAERAINSIR